MHTANSFTNYTVFSIWDTYRALHPLFTIIDQKRSNDFIKSLLAKYADGGRLPMWPMAGNYTDDMLGYHAVSVITDAYIKGHIITKMFLTAHQIYLGVKLLTECGSHLSIS